ncbi:hypothetical protein SAMN04490191_4404 [Pseudomonas lini]|uniref:Uncharacterized protein n=1 Tax=Pseudomonas lini TaxID=163011 RepID=A0A1H2AA67_9PSED|nr:hypothetical protein SAMN04490191_4404 [Pseudomonas lini]
MELLWRGGLPPLGCEAAPKVLRLLRSRTGASPLATIVRSHIGLAALKLNCSPVYQSHGNSSPDSEE